MHFLHPHFAHLQKTIPDSIIVRFESFSDGWPRIFLENKELIEWKSVTYIGDFRDVRDFFGQIAFLDWLARYHIDSLHIVIPFFPAASMERDTPSGELSIANVFARIFGLIGERHSGNIHIHIYDIHDEREIFYFPPSLQIHHHTTTNILKRKILENLLEKGGAESRGRSGGLAVSENLEHQSSVSWSWQLLSQGALKPIILFPDAGAKKGFSRFFTDYEVVTCAKVRKSPTEIDMFFEWWTLAEKNVIIVDDHIRSGSTLIEAARYAREKGANLVSAFAPHAVFAEGVKPEFLEAFDHFYTTDTIPENLERFSENEKVEVLRFWK